MKKYARGIITLLFLVVSTHAANILVWTFNHKAPDTLTDPEVAQTQPGSYHYWLKQCLTDNGYSFTVHDDTVLPSDISTYDVLMCAFGYRIC